MTKERIIMVILILVTLITLISQCQRANKETARADQYELDYYLAEEKATSWKESDSTWRAENRVLETTIDALEKSRQIDIEEFEKKIKDLKRSSNIEGIKLTTSLTKGQFKTKVNPVLNIECNHQFNFIAEDEWAKFNGSYNTGVLEWTYMVRDSVTYVSYWKRPGFLKKKQLVTQSISHNPNTQITGLNDIRIKVPKPMVQLSAGVSGTYFNEEFTLVPSIQLGIPIVTLFSK